MMRPVAVLLGMVVPGLVLGYGAPRASGPLEAVFARIDGVASGFKGLSADVHKVSHTEVINEDNVDDGVMVVKRPKPHEILMLVDLQKPDRKTVAVSGRKVEIYYPNMKTVQEYDAGRNRNLLEEFLLLGFGSTSADLQSGYTVRAIGQETVSGEKTTRLELIPKSKDAQAHLRKVELWIADATGLTMQQKFHQAGGDYTLATYSNIKLNPNLPDSALKLNLPKGVKRETPQK